VDILEKGLPKRLGEAWMQSWARLDATGHLRLLTPVAAPVSQTEFNYLLFPRSARYSLDEEGLLWGLYHIGPILHPMRFADAVAMAGQMAHFSQRRRAVVLLLGSDPEDQSEYTPEEARSSLRKLQVPLFVWSTASELPVSGWGDVLLLGSPKKRSKQARNLEEAVALLERALERQRVVWLAGKHLPQDIVLSEEAAGVGLAGGF
jgi:hypothetical protein